MNRYQVLIGGLLGLVIVFVVLTLRTPDKDKVSAALTETVGDLKTEHSLSGVTKTGDHVKRTSGDQVFGATRVREKVDKADVPKAAKGSQSVESGAEAKTPREKAVVAWETLVDQVVEQKEASMAEQSKNVKEAFDKLDKEDQMDGIHRSLNLFTDEQFLALYPILFDKAENPEVLDAIFSDALNRDETIKVPMMKELYKDKTHPMYVEAARILDATGELDDADGGGEADTTAEPGAATPTP